MRPVAAAHAYRDVLWLGECDAGVSCLARMLGWEEGAEEESRDVSNAPRATRGIALSTSNAWMSERVSTSREKPALDNLVLLLQLPLLLVPALVLWPILGLALGAAVDCTGTRTLHTF